MFFPLDDKFRMDNRRVIPYLYHIYQWSMYESKTTSKHHTVRNRGSPARNFFSCRKQTNKRQADSSFNTIGQMKYFLSWKCRPPCLLGYQRQHQWWSDRISNFDHCRWMARPNHSGCISLLSQFFKSKNTFSLRLLEAVNLNGCSNPLLMFRGTSITLSEAFSFTQ